MLGVMNRCHLFLLVLLTIQNCKTEVHDSDEVLLLYNTYLLQIFTANFIEEKFIKRPRRTTQQTLNWNFSFRT